MTKLPSATSQRTKRVGLRAVRAIGLEGLARSVRDRTKVGMARRALREHKQLERVIRGRLGPHSSAIDIGANEGQILEIIVEAAPHGRHVAFEPLPDLAERLRRDYPGVTVFPYALADGDGEVPFTRVKRAPARSGFYCADLPEDEVETFPVTRRTLDAALPDDIVPTVIKIDVEGAELEVLRGAQQTLTRHRPTVCFSLHPGPSPHAMHDLLLSLGYRVFDIDDNELGREEFANAFATERMSNFYAA